MKFQFWSNFAWWCQMLPLFSCATGMDGSPGSNVGSMS